MAGKNRDKYSDVDWNEELRKYRGEGKVKAIRLEFTEGLYRVWFEEDPTSKNVDSVDFKDRKKADEFLIEFGGRNEEIVAAPAELLKLDGFWNSGFLFNLGHRPISITVSGSHKPSSPDDVIRLPRDCGYMNIKDSKGREHNSDILITKKSGFVQTVGKITINFSKALKKWSDEYQARKKLKNFS